MAWRSRVPPIGRGVGEMLTGSRDHFVDGASNIPAHRRVEMGLDAWYAERFPEVCERRITPFLYGRGVGFLTRAYAATYRAAVDGWRFVRSHDLTSRRVGQALATMPLVRALMKASRPVARGQTCHALVTVVRGVLDAAYRKERLRSPGLGCLVPGAPPPGGGGAPGHPSGTRGAGRLGRSLRGCLMRIALFADTYPHDVNGVADACVRLLIDVEERTRLAAGARGEAISRSWDAILDGVLDAYAEVAAGAALTGTARPN